MTGTSHTRVTLTVYGPEPVIAAVESAVQADWARVLETAADDITMFIIDVAEPSAWQEPRTAFLRDPVVSGRLVAVSAEASARGLVQEGKEVPASANSAAELLVSRLS